MKFIGERITLYLTGVSFVNWRDAIPFSTSFLTNREELKKAYAVSLFVCCPPRPDICCEAQIAASFCNNSMCSLEVDDSNPVQKNANFTMDP